jgi:hypothetical protein
MCLFIHSQLLLLGFLLAFCGCSYLSERSCFEMVGVNMCGCVVIHFMMDDLGFVWKFAVKTGCEHLPF